MVRNLLSPSQKTRLHVAIQADFSSKDLDQFIWLKMKERPYLISRSLFPAKIDDVIDWAEDRSRTRELIRKLRLEKPGSGVFDAIWNEFRGDVVEKLDRAFPQSEPGELESIILKSAPFEDVEKWLERMQRIRHVVCRVEPQLQKPDNPNSLAGYGTGFLVGPNVIITNYHVAEYLFRDGRAATTRMRFGYDSDSNSSTDKTRSYPLADKAPLAFSPVAELDYALIRLASPAVTVGPTSTRPQECLKLKDHAFEKDEPLIILQHPSGKPLKLAMGAVASAPVDSSIAYTVNTEPGSSGSPCLTSSLEAVALHRWGGEYHNRGVRIGMILEHLRANGNANVLDFNHGI